jgi:crotonobetainyl-CoA:carnitine CoA-transferase CaiB-like acyl-CoA transferase
MATMIAHHYREITGEGQQVDTSIQASITWAITNSIPLWELNEINLARQGSFLAGRSAAGARQRLIWHCKDGFVAYTVFGARLGISMGNPRLMKWMDEEGMADEFLRSFDWAGYDIAKATQETQGKLESYVEKFFLSHTKLELYEGGLERDISIYPAYSPKDLKNDPQLEARKFWVGVEHPELNTTLTYPGTFFKTEEAPFKVRCRAPLIGEHNQEVYKELGISEEEIATLKQANVI